MLSALWTIGVVETGTDLCMKGGREGEREGGREGGRRAKNMNANLYVKKVFIQGPTQPRNPSIFVCYNSLKAIQYE